MATSATEYAALSRMFSSSVFRELLTTGRSPLLLSLIKSARLENSICSSVTLADLFEIAFKKIESSGLRDEYVFRNAVTRRVLLGIHTLRTSTLLTEFRVANRRADMVVLNGSACAYEIKSDRDNLTRVQEQVAKFSCVFASVNVLASDKYAKSLLVSFPEDIGVVTLSSDFHLTTHRKAIDRPERIVNGTVFESLTSAEVVQILIAMNERVPEVSNIELRRALKIIFENLDKVDLHRQMVETLKQTRSLSHLKDYVSLLPKSLLGVTMATRPNRKLIERVIPILDSPFTSFADSHSVECDD